MAASDEVLENPLGVIAAPRPKKTAMKSKDLGGLRRCAIVGCEVALSRYNDTPRCWLHGPGSDPMLRPR